MKNTTETGGSADAAGFQTLDRHQTSATSSNVHEYEAYVPNYSGYEPIAQQIAQLAGYKYFVQRRTLKVTASGAPVKNSQGKTLSVYDLARAKKPTPPPHPNRERDYPQYKSADWKERVRKELVKSIAPNIIGIAKEELSLEIEQTGQEVELRIIRKWETHGVSTRENLVVTRYYGPPSYSYWGCSIKHRPIKWEPGELHCYWKDPEVLAFICEICKKLIRH